MRYFREIRIRIAGDQDLGRRYVPHGRVLIGQLMNELRLSGNASGHRHLTDATGVTYRMLVMGSVPILEIDVQAVAPSHDPLGEFVVWPSEPADLHAFGLTPQVMLGWFGKRWRAAFFDVASQPTGTPGSLYETQFAAGLVQQGNIDWVSTDGRLACSWYGPRSRYFMDRSPADIAGAPGEVAYGEHRFHAEVFIKGRSVIDVETVSVGLIGEADVYVKGACIRRNNGAPFLFVVVAKFGGSGVFTYEFDMREWVLRFELEPSTSAAVIGVVAGSGALIGSYEGDDEYEADHPWMFNGSGSHARTLRKHSEAPYTTISVRELLLTMSHSSASFSVVETVAIPPAVASTTSSSTGSFGYHPTLVEDYRWDATSSSFVTDSNTVTTSINTVPYGLATDFPSSGTVDTTASRRITQPQNVKAAVDYIGASPVYAYSLAANEQLDRSDSRSRAYTLSEHPRVVGHTDDGVSTVLSVTGTYASNSSMARAFSQTVASRTGGIQTPFVTVESRSSSTVTATASGAGTWQSTYKEYRDGVTPDEYLGGSSSLILSSSSSTTAVDVETHVLYLDLRYRAMAVLEIRTTVTVEIDLALSSTPALGAFGQLPDPVSIAPNRTRTSLTEHVFTIYAHGKVVHTETLAAAPVVTTGMTAINVQPKGFMLAELSSFVGDITGLGVIMENPFNETPPALTATVADGTEIDRSTLPYFERYIELLAVSAAASSPLAASRLDNDAFAHCGSVTSAPQFSDVYLWAFPFVSPGVSAAFHWRSGIFSGDIPTLTGRAATDAYAPITYLPPTSSA